MVYVKTSWTFSLRSLCPQDVSLVLDVIEKIKCVWWGNVDAFALCVGKAKENSEGQAVLQNIVDIYQYIVVEMLKS